jgi:hypothetical protein
MKKEFQVSVFRFQGTDAGNAWRLPFNASSSSLNTEHGTPNTEHLHQRNKQ